jgi:hypothetical protein
MAQEKETIFTGVFDALRAGRKKDTNVDEKKVLTNVPENKFASKEQQQQDFLDIQSSKIAKDLYSRSLYYEADRFVSYQDFRGMDQSPEISAALDILADECLAANTKIYLLDGTTPTIEELFSEEKTNFDVYSYDTTREIIITSKCEKVAYKGEQDVYRVVFDNDSYVDATSEHLWLIKGTGNYVTTDELETGIIIQPCYSKIKNKPSLGLLVDLKVKYIEFVGPKKTYDLVNVGEFHNFAILTSNGTGLFSHNCVTKNERGEILAIYSDNSRVKTTLKDLFYNVMNINYNLGFWTREFLKYGDMFLKLEIDQKLGIYDVIMLPVAELHREEAPNGQIGASRFKWDVANLYFEEWQVAHFRRLTDSSRLPYGISILEPARKLWKQLQLAEDAMLVYRLIRSPERRVYYLEVGNIDPVDIPQYMEKMKAQIKKSPLVDPNTGNINLKYNPMPIWKNTPIPLLDGRTLTIEEMSKEYESGKINYVYSVQDKTHNIVPGKVVWCGKNYTAEKLTKVWLDDNTWVLTAQEHPFLLRDGSQKEAQDLIEGDALMPFYVSEEEIYKTQKKYKYKYTTIYNPKSGTYKFVHRLIANEIPKANPDYNTRHHKDFNRLNNSPENIEWVDFVEHRKMHQEIINRIWAKPGFREAKSAQITAWNKSDEKFAVVRKSNLEKDSKRYLMVYNNSEKHSLDNEIRSSAMTEFWSNENNKKSASKAMTIKINERCFDIIIKEIQKHNEFINVDDFFRSLKNTEMADIMNELNKDLRRYKPDKFYSSGHNFPDILRMFGIDNYKHFLQTYNPLLLISKKEQQSKRTAALNKNNIGKKRKKNVYKNHKVLRTEIIYTNDEDVYCMTVVGLNEENDRHNFALYSFNEDGTCSKSGVFVKNSYEDDMFIAIRNGVGSRIETLPGASNLDAISDVEYLQNKLFAALKVPKPYLNYTETIPGGSMLAQSDLRFSRTINRLQQFVVIEMRRIANIHLHFLGLDDDINNFEITLTNPSTQQELLKLETMKARLEVFKEMFNADVIAPVSYTWAMQYIMGFSEFEIKQILRQKKIERKMFAEIEGAVEEYGETGIFKELDSKFRKPGFDPDAQPTPEGEGGMDAGAGGGGMGGLGGGGSLSSGGLDGGGGLEDMGAAPGGDDMGAAPETEGGAEEELPEEPLSELFDKKAKPSNILETKNIKMNNRAKLLISNIDATIKALEEQTKIREEDTPIEPNNEIVELDDNTTNDVE